MRRQGGRVARWRLLLLLTPACLLMPVCAIEGAAQATVEIATTATQFPALSSIPLQKRQLEIDGPFTFTFPVPAPVTTTPPPPTNPNTSPIPLLFSPYFLSASGAPNPATSASAISPTSTPSSSLANASIVPNAKANTNNNNNSGSNATSQSHLSATTFLPVIILVSVFLIALTGWCLHGWCTRRPKAKMMEDERRKRGWLSFDGNATIREGLVCGPEYVGFKTDGEQDTEYVGYPVLGRGRTERFKWPTLSMAERQGYRHRLLPEVEERDNLSNGRIETLPPVQASNPNSNPNRSSPSEKRVVDKLVRNPPSASTMGITSPTSIALKELYETVLKSGKSSPRSGLIQECDQWRKDEEGEEERTPLLGLVSASGSGVHMTNQKMSGQKRRGHVRRDSSLDDFIWSGNVIVTRGFSNSEGGGGRKLEVRNPSVGPGRLGFRESGDDEEDSAAEEVGLVEVDLESSAKKGRVKAEEEKEEIYTPLPTPTRTNVPRSQIRPPVGVNLKDGEFDGVVLPAHPKQIMSPPVESQMLFVPIQGGGGVGSDGIMPRSRDARQSKTKLRPKSQSRERLAAAADERAKVRENRKGSTVVDSKQTGDRDSGIEGHGDEALKRVERIMERGWMERSMAS